MGEECGSYFDFVSCLESRLAEQSRGQFHGRDVSGVHVDAGQIDEACGCVADFRRAKEAKLGVATFQPLRYGGLWQGPAIKLTGSRGAGREQST
jgi:hypothetical protein